jgi:phosphoenolpyruvate carboxykinase (ATP)
VKAIAEGTASWTEDPDFGYVVAEAVPGIDDPELLQPRRLYERQGRQAEYADLVQRFKAERRGHLKGFPELSKGIVVAAG